MKEDVKMQTTISSILSSYRPLLAKQPQEFQLKLLWLLLEAFAADTDQLKAYVNALHESLGVYIGAINAYSEANAGHAARLAVNIEELMAKEFT